MPPPPPQPTPVPPAVLARHAPGWAVTLAYSAFPRLTTWRLTHPDGRVRFAKVDAAPAHPTLGDEAARMEWAAPFLPVPAVVALQQADGCVVLLTEGLPGEDATDPVWQADLAALVRAFGAGLAAFHAAVDQERCPFRFDNAVALDHVRARVASGEAAPKFQQEFGGLNVEAALAELEHTVPSTEDLVVCHGDYCPPNALLTRGAVTGYVDLGELGVADRWRDISIGGWSTSWNFGPAYEALFYQGYGIAPDPARIRFYRLLWSFAS